MIDLSNIPTGKNAFDFEMNAEAREKAYYSLFGESFPDRKILSPGDAELAINWPGGGIYQYPATEAKDYWHYITSGLTQPLDDQEDLEGDYSGYGIELSISTKNQEEWVPAVLLNLAQYLLFEGGRVIWPGHRLPCNGPLVIDSDTELCYLVAAEPKDYDWEIRLPAGYCDLVHLIGVTEAEIEVAQSLGGSIKGSIVLCDVLERLGPGYITDPERKCITTDSDFEKVWNEVLSDREIEWAKENQQDNT